MTIVVQISDFRNNMAGYLDQARVSKRVITIMKGKKVVAEVRLKIPQTKMKNGWDSFREDLEKIWATQPKTTKKTDYSVRVDEILYGKK